MGVYNGTGYFISAEDLNQVKISDIEAQYPKVRDIFLKENKNSFSLEEDSFLKLLQASGLATEQPIIQYGDSVYFTGIFKKHLDEKDIQPRIGQRSVDPRNGYLLVFNGLSQDLQCAFFKLWQFIQEQYAKVRQRYFTRGARLGELLALTWNDIDFTHCEIKISKTLEYQKDKTTNKFTHKVVAPKTVTSNRGVKKVFVRSGIRYDFLLKDKNKSFFKELVKYHVSGQLRVAPEHVAGSVLRSMGKPGFKSLTR